MPSRQPSPEGSVRRHVGLTLPRDVKSRLLEAAAAIEWSAGRWVLAAAAEEGPRLRAGLEGDRVRKRPGVPDATFTALYVSEDERDELDDQAVACGLNRSAFVTSVARLALGDDFEDVCRQLR